MPPSVTPVAAQQVKVVGPTGQTTYVAGTDEGIKSTESSLGLSPSLINTSSQSRAAYNNNVTSLGNANANITPPSTKTDATSTGGGSTPVINIHTGSGDANASADAGASTTQPTSNGTDAEGDPTAGLNLPPEIAKQYKASLANQDQILTDAKSTLDAASATLNNDPAAAAAAASIAAKYDILIQAMKDKNRIVLGSYSQTAARNGGYQYANELTTSFMSGEMDKASARVADLVSQEQEMILKSNQAYKTGDLKAFNEAQTAYDKANNDKISALGKLLTATNNQVKQVQAQQKIDAATAKATAANDISLSKNLSTSIVKNIMDSGITDQAQIDAYIDQVAGEQGISNPEVLRSAVLTAQQAQSKADLAAKNTQSIIDKRNQAPVKKAAGGGTDGSYVYSADDVNAYKTLLNKGGTGPDGTTYAARGTDTYVDPNAYIAAYVDWKGNGGTPAGFLKKFPISSVNPASISKLPAELQPKTKTVAAAPPLPAKK